jgi:hypothetical protein
MGTMSFDEQQTALDAAKANNSIAQAEYDEGTARINAGKASASKAVAENPYQFAIGGSVDGSPGTDDLSMGGGGMPMGPQFNMGGIAGLSTPNFAPDTTNVTNTPEPSNMRFAMGGSVPRFLEGGGDGMSDSIRATIDGKREARLADGEFVVPADVVSGIGNGSSKAGAKQLYSMMDRVRKARTGTVKQGKKINPQKMLMA